MILNVVSGILLWTATGVALLFVLMIADAYLTRYNDMEEIKKGNMAVITRFVMKLFAQGYILSQSISSASLLWDALLISVISFVILLLIETLVRVLLKRVSHLDLSQGTKEGNVGFALFSGTLHVVGALIIGAYL